jgi:hypothetical protein
MYWFWQKNGLSSILGDFFLQTRLVTLIAKQCAKRQLVKPIFVVFIGLAPWW